jgi:hypothetical protein
MIDTMELYTVPVRLEKEPARVEQKVWFILASSGAMLEYWLKKRVARKINEGYKVQAAIKAIQKFN